MSVDFGWSYPPGCSGVPDDDRDEEKTAVELLAIVLEAIANGPNGDVLTSEADTWNPKAHIDLTLTAEEVFKIQDCVTG